MGEFSPWHWLIVIAVFVVLFGAKRLPSTARSVGQSLRILKAELNSRDESDDQAPATRIEEGPGPSPHPQIRDATPAGDAVSDTRSPDAASGPPPRAPSV